MSYNFIICSFKYKLEQDTGFAIPINKKKDDGIQLIFIINKIKKLFKAKLKRRERKIIK